MAPGSTKDCEGTDDETIKCTPGAEAVGSPEPWNPLPDFTTVRENKQVRNVVYHDRFFRAARKGSLPSVSWIVPGWEASEHPPELVSKGQAWVTRVVNAVMKSSNWKSSAIFVAWDDWGGYTTTSDPGGSMVRATDSEYRGYLSARTRGVDTSTIRS